MDAHLKEGFFRMKPICDMVMVNPSPAHIKTFQALVSEMKTNVLQELQQYMLFPFITHLQSKENQSKYDLQRIVVNGMKEVLQRVIVNSYEMCLKIEMASIGLIFDKSKPGMVADVPEELKLSVMQCLTVLMLKLDPAVRLKLLENQMPLLAQSIFVSVHLAKLEKLRALRLAAIESLNAHIACHKLLTGGRGYIPDLTLERAVVKLTSTILPGVLAALQDVATCADNPGHGVIVAALNATHIIICLTMNNKHVSKRKEITAADFVQMLSNKTNTAVDVSNKDKKTKDIPKNTREWYTMAGEKLKCVVSSLVLLVTHEHHRVRRELAELCHRVMTECSETMQPSLPLCVEVLMSLSTDRYPEVAHFCGGAVRDHFSREGADDALDSLCDNFFLAINNLPRVLNNIDSARKLSALNSVLGYVRVLAAAETRRPPVLSPQRLRGAMLSLVAAAALETPPGLLTRHAARDVSVAPPNSSCWCVLRHLEAGEGTELMRQVCRALGALSCAPLLLDILLQMLPERACEPVFIINWLATAPDASPELARRLITEYMQEDVWYSPLDVGTEEVEGEPVADTGVYDPRAWTKESVPGLYEGATEIRYTDVSYLEPRVRRTRVSLAEVQRNVLRSCLLVEGLGLAARRLGQDYQPWLLKTLCPMLERVGSKYWMLHLAGLGALHEVALAFGRPGVAELIADNADYFTSQITAKLKKAWSLSAALQILAVVLEYSDAGVLDHLYGIVDDVLVQSCDRYYQQDLHSYLQVFLTFVTRIRQWFPGEDEEPSAPDEIDVLKDVVEFIKNEQKAEKLMEIEEFEKECGKSAEEMYREDAQKREEDLLEYDDTVATEAEPLPQHVKVTISVIRRCIHFIPSKSRDEALLALQVLTHALPVLACHEDELLPLVHQTWGALVGRFTGEPPVVRRCLDLLMTLAVLSKDFIRSRTVKEVLPNLYKFLHKSSKDSYLKDAGSCYRLSQAFQLQLAALDALPALVSLLKVDEDTLGEAMVCAELYLSKKQPKPLQDQAVKFFRDVLSYNYGAAWHHLRLLCDNRAVLSPPAPAARVGAGVPLEPIAGTPYEAADVDYNANIQLIFNK